MLHFLVTLQTLVAERTSRAKDDEGATAVEYGLMVALIAGGIIVAVTALRTALVAKFDAVAAAITGIV